MANLQVCYQDSDHTNHASYTYFDIQDNLSQAEVQQAKELYH